ncbi:TIGR03751 family conjugal transfer lipoprotein [Hydrogenovibrio sp. SC-1]|uniref:TIGR03751 family conjugal transfer lipoprotein n=1 Tax=Hydrogenovibrio sp. SC-1 TaxID=2065820 RepID=UPI001E2F6F12|nr:TIGR03751 family conjugal transfer lipoprotein [Hydrogenovibrio sp. SC-1]
MSKNGPSTAELMRQPTMQSNTSSSNKYLRPVYETNYSDYTRNANNELNHLFPRLPNPTLVMFIYPHISSSGVPVPGYSTAFSMYEKAIEYALPGETPYNVR